MSKGGGARLIEHFGEMEDPRMERSKRHKLLDIVVIAICGVICGADDWVAIADFGRAKQAWLSQFLELPNGIPSHDTFGRVFARLDPEQFQACFRQWVQAVFKRTKGQVVAVDGKQLCGSYDTEARKAAIQMVSAWANRNQLVLGQVKVHEKSNEIPAIPALLKLLDVSGCIVTVAAMGCQKAIATQIVESGADYVLALKENQEQLFTEVRDLFRYAEECGFKPVVADYHLSDSKHHGRFERRCWTIAEPELLHMLRDYEQGANLHTLVMVQAERTTPQQTTLETRFFISSLPAQAAPLLAAVYGYWGIENRLHWVLDVAFREDACRVRKDHAPHNLAIVRHIALNLLKQESSAKVGLKTKHLRAGWDEAYLLQVLS